MKAKIISCGILAALLTSAAFAQHARLSSGSTVPAARMPNAVTAPPSSPNVNVGHAGIAPSAGITPNAGVAANTNVGHDGVAPDAQTTSAVKVKKSKTAKPAPDTREFGNRTATSF